MSDSNGKFITIENHYDGGEKRLSGEPVDKIRFLEACSETLEI